MKPTDIRPVGDKELLITWETGERSLYANKEIQLSCQCASCVDEMTGKQLVTENQIDPNVKILGVEPIGNYGVKFRWSSGCQTGIFSFQHLYAMRTQPKP